ncbi:MAG: methylated-DNA--[protein]-cysteine S-methyltransferase [Planctomycetota bacterium]|jgi:methylated-DNA-[protein]-cysteine S-methyltransferase
MTTLTSPDSTLVSMTIDTPLGACVAMAAGEALCLFEFLETEDDRAAAQIEAIGAADASEGENDVLRATRKQMDAYFAGELREFDLPLDLRGTEFQRGVWRELCAIPFGETISYGELARRVGDVNKSRAVGAANGRNPVAVIVPCHRVIASSGVLQGYGGGLWRKERLLQHEGGLFASA